MTITESIVEDAALAWLGELQFAELRGPEIAPGEVAVESQTAFPTESSPPKMHFAFLL
jgi:hypothetical protein